MYRVIRVAVSKIEIKDQALRYEPEDDSIIELANSIQSDGLLQPVGVAEEADGVYQLLWGGRRLAAIKRLRHDTVLAHVYDLGERPVKGVALVENLQRVNLTLKEECDGVAFLHYDQKKSPDQISALLSKSRSWVMRRLALPNLPEELRGPVFDGRLSIGAAEELGRLEDSGARAYLANQAVQCGWKLSDVRTAVETYLSTPSIEAAVEAGAQVRAEQSAAQVVLKQCAACGRPAELTALVNVWIHANGCPAELVVVEEGKSHGS